MIYVLCNPAVADDLNRSFMRLMRPSHMRNGYATDFYTTKVTHPESGYCALAIPENEQVPVHVESDGSELAYMLDIFVADNAMTEEEAEAVKIQIPQLAGSSISILEFIPDSWSGFVLTRQQMEEQGWFPQLDLEA